MLKISLSDTDESMGQFSGYLKIDKQTFREDFGLTYDDLQVGQRFQHRPGVTVTQQDNLEEALDTLNNAQLHYDAHYAGQTEWKAPLGVSTMTLQKVIGMTSKTFGKRKSLINFDSISMRNPVFDGTTLYAESEVLELFENCRVKVRTRGLDQSGKEVLDTIYTLEYPSEAPDQSRVQEERFSAYRELDDGSLREKQGLFFEEFKEEEQFEHRPAKRFTAEESRLHALRSLNIFSSHQDEKSPIDESFIVGSLTALTTRTFGKVVANLSWTHVSFDTPLYPGDWLLARSKVLETRESKSRPDQGLLHILTEGLNQKGKIVCSFQRHLLVYKRNQGPYATSGY